MPLRHHVAELRRIPRARPPQHPRRWPQHSRSFGQPRRGRHATHGHHVIPRSRVGRETLTSNLGWQIELSHDLAEKRPSTLARLQQHALHARSRQEEWDGRHAAPASNIKEPPFRRNPRQPRKRLPYISEQRRGVRTRNQVRRPVPPAQQRKEPSQPETHLTGKALAVQTHLPLGGGACASAASHAAGAERANIRSVRSCWPIVNRLLTSQYRVSPLAKP